MCEHSRAKLFFHGLHFTEAWCSLFGYKNTKSHISRLLFQFCTWQADVCGWRSRGSPHGSGAVLVLDVFGLSVLFLLMLNKETLTLLRGSLNPGNNSRRISEMRVDNVFL